MEQFGTRQASSVQVKRREYLKTETLNIMITIINNFIQTFFHSHIFKKYIHDRKLFQKIPVREYTKTFHFQKKHVVILPKFQML